MGQAQVCCLESEKTGEMEVEDAGFSILFCHICNEKPDSQCENTAFSTSWDGVAISYAVFSF
jgi:hypothetical protein